MLLTCEIDPFLADSTICASLKTTRRLQNSVCRETLRVLLDPSLGDDVLRVSRDVFDDLKLFLLTEHRPETG